MQYTLTPELAQRIFTFISAGGVPWVCAEACGIPREIFDQWMQRGRSSEEEPFLGFYQGVLEHHAQARLTAELGVKKDDPLSWLKYGPGRATSEYPGWGTSLPERSSKESVLALREQTYQLLCEIGRLLRERYPDAAQAVAEHLARSESAERNPAAASHYQR